MPQNKNNKQDVAKLVTRLDAVLEGQKKLLIVLHNNPDPDCMASAFALSFLAQKRYNIESKLIYGGIIGRAENRIMARELNIPLVRASRIGYKRYDRIALVDTQPTAGNNIYPDDAPFHIVIDHHAYTSKKSAPFSLNDPQVGATATLLIELLEACDLMGSIQVDLATALVYGIRSETQDLGRETGPRDVKAYLWVFVKASMPKLARITHPRLSRSYYKTLGNALRNAKSYRHLMVSDVGTVTTPDIVAEVADLLLRHERISWTFCTGQFRKDIIISIRSSQPNAKAGQLIRALLKDRKNCGGHDTYAGGKMSVKDLPAGTVLKMIDEIQVNFARQLGVKKVKWKNLII
jgi:nanoRNase/pAp phosphatase (c-di-AMP/oligoRNAs hydrolase)